MRGAVRKSINESFLTSVGTIAGRCQGSRQCGPIMRCAIGKGIYECLLATIGAIARCGQGSIERGRCAGSVAIACGDGFGHAIV